MSNPACDVCGKPMRLFGKQYKCMTSPKDHKKILDSLDRGVRAPGQERSPAQEKAKKKLIPGYHKKKKKGGS